MTRLRTQLAGVAFLGVLVLLGWLAVAIYDKDFDDAELVTLRADRVGNQLAPTAEVKVKGVPFGEVRAVRSTRAGAEIDLALDPAKIGLLPGNVSARLLPKTVFGERYVNLVLPDSPQGRLQAGDVITQDRSANAIELERVLGDLLPLLRAVQPQKLNSSLGAISQALDNRGKPLGDSFVQLKDLLAQLNPLMPQFKADVRTLQNRGQKVIISVGGQNGTISVNDSNSANNFANSIKSLIANYGFDGVDIDLENGINATYMGQALRSIHNGGGKVITMAPQTIDMQSTAGGYFQLALNIKDILTIVNMQYYNSGSMNGCNGNVYAQGTVDFLTALACIQLQGGLRADQVGLGLPASPQAAGGGYQAPANTVSALNCLARGTSCGSFKPPATYPSIRGAMTWSINWDASQGYAFANTVSAGLAGLP